MNDDRAFRRPDSLRLGRHDYRSRGAYYVTLCSHERQRIFSTVVDCGPPRLSPLGEIARDTLLELPAHYRDVRVDEWVAMPDHIHAILWLRSEGLDDLPVEFSSLSEVVRGFKSLSAKRINRALGTPGAPVYQRGFFDRVIRDERELGDTRVYIRRNPQRWLDRYGAGVPASWR